MAETTIPLPILDPTQTTAGYPQIPPYDALTQHHRPEAPAFRASGFEEEWSVADQARILHEEIFDFQNGIPDPDMFSAAQEFMGHVTYDRNAQDGDAGSAHHRAEFADNQR